MVTKFLLSEGVPVDINYGRGTPLFLAAESGQDKTLEILLDHGADVYVLHFSYFLISKIKS